MSGGPGLRAAGPPLCSTDMFLASRSSETTTSGHVRAQKCLVWWNYEYRLNDSMSAIVLLHLLNVPSSFVLQPQHSGHIVPPPCDWTDLSRKHGIHARRPVSSSVSHFRMTHIWCAGGLDSKKKRDVDVFSFHISPPV